MKRSDSQSDSLVEIAAGLNRLCQELAVLRELLNEIRDELQWANRNGTPGKWSARTAVTPPGNGNHKLAHAPRPAG